VQTASGALEGGTGMKILKCLLMIVTAPVVLVLTLFVWLCTGLIYISGLVLGLLSTVIALPELGEGEAIDTSIPADPNVKNYSYAG
jgi:hypothetical protein